MRKCARIKHHQNPFKTTHPTVSKLTAAHPVLQAGPRHLAHGARPARDREPACAVGPATPARVAAGARRVGGGGGGWWSGQEPTLRGRKVDAVGTQTVRGRPAWFYDKRLVTPLWYSHLLILILHSVRTLTWARVPIFLSPSSSPAPFPSPWRLSPSLCLPRLCYRHCSLSACYSWSSCFCCLYSCCDGHRCCRRPAVTPAAVCCPSALLAVARRPNVPLKRHRGTARVAQPSEQSAGAP